MVSSLPAQDVHEYSFVACLQLLSLASLASSLIFKSRVQSGRSVTVGTQAGSLQRHPATSPRMHRSAPHLLLPGSWRGSRPESRRACHRARTFPLVQPSHIPERCHEGRVNSIFATECSIRVAWQIRCSREVVRDLCSLTASHRAQLEALGTRCAACTHGQCLVHRLLPLTCCICCF